MNTLFIDSFDHYSTLTDKWDGASGAASIVSNIFRTGSQALRLNFLGYVSRFLRGNQRTVVAGVALYRTVDPTVQSGSTWLPFMTVRANGSPQMTLTMRSTGQVEIRRGAFNGTFIAVSNLSIPKNQWGQVEFRCFVDNNVGEWELYINGVLDSSGVTDTQNTANNYVDEILLLPVGDSTTYFDDFFVRGDTGYFVGGNVGDCRIYVIKPDGPGTYTDLISSSGNPNWQNVDEPIASTTDYNSSNVAGAQDSYNFENLVGTTGPVRTLQVCNFVRKDDSGTRGMQPLVISGATEDLGTDTPVMTTYFFNTECWDEDPNTSAPWTIGAVDAAQFGLKIT